MRYLFAWITVAAAWGQTLQIPPAAVSRGSANLFRLIFTSAADRRVAALQWELVIPQELQIDTGSVVPGTAAEAAGKSIKCAGRTEPKTGKILTCILAGGADPIQDGAVAIVKFSAAGDAQRGVVTARIQKVIGVSVDLKKITIADAGGAITIR